MTLRVPFDGFVEAVKRHIDSQDVYVFSDEAKTVLTAGCQSTPLVIICSTKHSQAEASKSLTAAGLKVHEGIWSVDDDTELLSLPYVAAVSYRANALKTGVWVEAFATRPTEVDVLQRMIQEFQENGEMPELDIEAFREVAQASIQILSPLQIQEFLTGREN
jgi:hypothetical protein